MTVRDVGTVGSCEAGMAVCRVLTTMSIGRSNIVTLLSNFLMSCCGSALGVLSLSAVSVISASGVACLACTGGACECGSGEADGCGVGSAIDDSSGTSSVIAMDALLLRAARTPFADRLFGGDAALLGEVGSTTLSGGLNICDGSTDSLKRAFRVRPVVRGVAGSSVVFLREGALVVLAGAGVNSSSFSSGRRLMIVLSSSSDSSTTLRRVAIRREGRTGDSVDIVRGLLTPES